MQELTKLKKDTEEKEKKDPDSNSDKIDQSGLVTSKELTCRIRFKRDIETKILFTP